MGFSQAGYKCVFSSEINEDCQKVYFKNFKELPYGDIASIHPKEIPDFDVLVGGFPCQPFSICGKKQGFKDTRGTLFFEICKIIEEKQPSYIVLENVKHLIYHDKTRTLSTIINSLTGLGYKVNYKILNAKDFGLPQHRERIFIIGTKNFYFDFKKLRTQATPPLRDFLEEEGNFEILKKGEYTLIDAPRKQDSGLVFVGYRNKNTWKIGIRPNTEHLSRVHRQPNRIYSIDGTHPTLPSQETSGRFFIYIPEKRLVRKLTLNECFRIMGFPKNFVKHQNIGECYKQIGNSVCVPLIKEIALSLTKQESLNKNEPQRKVDRNLQPVLFDL